MRFVSETSADAARLGTNTVMESAAALGMFGAFMDLETSITAPDHRESGTTGPFAIHAQSGQSFQKFQRSLNEAAGAARSGMTIAAPDRTTDLQNASGPGRSALLKNIGDIHSAMERPWRDYTNALATAPEKAGSIRDQFLLPMLHDRLRPALADYWRDLAGESALAVQPVFRSPPHSQKFMLLLLGLTLLAILAAAVFVTPFILEPAEQPAHATKGTESQAGGQIVKRNLELEPHVSRSAVEPRDGEGRHRALPANLQGIAYRCRNDRERRMEFVSEGCRNLLGVEPEDFMSGALAYNHLIHPEDQEQVWNEIQSAVARQDVFTLEYRVKHANGQWRNVSDQGRAVLDSQGRVAALEGCIADVTRRAAAEGKCRILEDQLFQSQKLEVIGTLTGGIAHDFNNALAAILGSAGLIKMDLPPEHPSREFLDQIFTVGNHAREVVQQILTFSRQQGSERRVIYLQSVVQECVKLLDSSSPATVNISCQVDPDCPPVLANSTQIYQVIMNLCMNAWQAMPGNSGNILVDLAMCDIDPKMSLGHPGLSTGPAVRLSIHDNGSGMDKATLEQVFEPFFTTKPVGKGSGLGLTVVRDIVKTHQGVITVESEPGKGTVFRIYLPPQANEEEATPAESSIVFSVKHERILFVDDDEFAGVTMERLLERLGYRVRRFQYPEEALAQFQADPAEFDLVISDLAMPGMTGDKLAASLVQIRPNIPILITTGLMDSPILKKQGETGIRNVLLKPVSTETLAREVARQLGNEPGSGIGDGVIS